MINSDILTLGLCFYFYLFMTRVAYKFLAAEGVPIFIRYYQSWKIKVDGAINCLSVHGCMVPKLIIKVPILFKFILGNFSAGIYLDYLTGFKFSVQISILLQLQELCA
uniref:Uncharacterized protein n=1 Tax=Cacopsylla melanoneura TaxID=428564 RepID=A0A8D9B8V5_9HEMI